MPQGLQILDNSGNVILDSTTFVGNLINSFTTTSHTGSITNNLLTKGTPFGFASVPSLPQYNSGAPSFRAAPVYPVISFSGNRLSWSWDEEPSEANGKSITIYYGIF